MLRHCGCVSPPMISTENVTYCNFVDLPCLRQWNAIWYDWNYFDHADKKADDEHEPSSASQCPHCLPTCDGIKFRIYLNEMTMRRAYGGAYSHGLL